MFRSDAHADRFEEARAGSCASRSTAGRRGTRSLPGATGVTVTSARRRRAGSSSCIGFSGCFAIACRNWVWNVIGCAVDRQDDVAGLAARPARPPRPGSPTEARVRRSGSTPISPISNRLSADATGVDRRVVSAPSRRSVIATSRLGRVPTAMKKSCQVSTRRPPTDQDPSPRWMPACAAGEPSATTPTTGGWSSNAGTSAPGRARRRAARRPAAGSSPAP